MKKGKKKIFWQIAGALSSLLLVVIVVILLIVGAGAAIGAMWDEVRGLFTNKFFTTEEDKQAQYRIFYELNAGRLSASDLLYALTELDLTDESRQTVYDAFTEEGIVSMEDFLEVLRVCSKYEPSTYISGIRQYRTIKRTYSAKEFERFLRSMESYVIDQDSGETYTEQWEKLQGYFDEISAARSADSYKAALTAAYTELELMEENCGPKAFLYTEYLYRRSEIAEMEIQPATVDYQITGMKNLDDPKKQSVTVIFEVCLEDNAATISDYNYWLDYGLTWKSIYALAVMEAFERQEEEETSSSEIEAGLDVGSETEATEESGETEEPMLQIDLEFVEEACQTLLASQTAVELENNSVREIDSYLGQKGYPTLATRRAMPVDSDILSKLPYQDQVEGDPYEEKGQSSWKNITSVCNKFRSSLGSYLAVVSEENDRVTGYQLRSEWDSFLSNCSSLMGTADFEYDMLELYLEFMPGGETEVDTIESYREAYEEKGHIAKQFSYDSPIYLATVQLISQGSTGEIINNGYAYFNSFGQTSATILYTPTDSTCGSTQFDSAGNQVYRALSQVEIDTILNGLHTTEDRYKLVKLALESVGKIPYSQLQNGSLIAKYGSREANARMDSPRYLDCSAFISWCYFKTGIYDFGASAYTGTFTAAGSARASLAQMQPGDWMVWFGQNHHVVMFVGWSEDGFPVVVDENGSGNGGIDGCGGTPGNIRYRKLTNWQDYAYIRYIIPGEAPEFDHTDNDQIKEDQKDEATIVLDPALASNSITRQEPVGPGASQTVIGLEGGITAANGYTESQFTLDVALKVQKYLEENFSYLNVLLTRSSPSCNMTNAERAQMANERNPLALVQIRANSSIYNGQSGGEILAPSGSNQYLNQVDPQLTEDSKLLAVDIADSMSRGIVATSVRENDGRAIINYSEHPVCIVRCGYLTNPSEATNLQDEEYQQRLAEAIGNGLIQFYLDHGSNQNRTD